MAEEAPKSFDEIASGVLDSVSADATSTATSTGTTDGQAGTETSTETGADVQSGGDAQEGQDGQEQALSLRDLLAQDGFQFQDGDDDAVAQQRLIEAYRQEQQELAQLKQQLELQRLQQLYAQQQSQTAQTTQPTQDTQTQSWWNPPQVDEAQLRPYIAYDAEGNMQFKPETPPQLKQAYEARQAYFQDFARQFVQNPEAALAPMFEQQQRIIDQRVQQAIQSIQQQQQQASAMDQFVEQNPWIYQLDPKTNQPRRAQDGSYLLTDGGARLDSILNDLIEQGVPQTTALEAALGLYRVRYGDESSNRKESIAATRLAHLKNAATGNANRGGHAASLANGSKAAAKQNNSMIDGRAFGERFADHLAAMGVTA